MVASRRRSAIVIAVVGTTLVTGYAAIALAQILWLNPLAAAGGRSLDEMQNDLAAAGESLGAPVAIAVMGLGPLLAFGLTVVVCAMEHHDPSLTALQFLGLLTFGAVAYVVASFQAGAALADTYSISGADYAPWGAVLGIVSATALAAALVLGLVTVRRRYASQLTAAARERSTNA